MAAPTDSRPGTTNTALFTLSGRDDTISRSADQPFSTFEVGADVGELRVNLDSRDMHRPCGRSKPWRPSGRVSAD